MDLSWFGFVETHTPQHIILFRLLSRPFSAASSATSARRTTWRRA